MCQSSATRSTSQQMNHLRNAVRRCSMMYRVKRILVRDGHDVYVNDGVLFSDGIAKFCVRRGFLNNHSDDSSETSVKTVSVARGDLFDASRGGDCGGMRGTCPPNIPTGGTTCFMSPPPKKKNLLVSACHSVA